MKIGLKQIILIAIATISLILIALFKGGFYKTTPAINNTSTPQVNTQTGEIDLGDGMKIISTNPKALDNSVILPTQTIEITFNLPLENVGEFKNRIEPKADYKVELSSDRKTAKIIPQTPFNLGTSYTLFILPDTKFDGKKRLQRDFIFHFSTINYNGA